MKVALKGAAEKPLWIKNGRKIHFHKLTSSVVAPVQILWNIWVKLNSKCTKTVQNVHIIFTKTFNISVSTQIWSISAVLVKIGLRLLKNDCFLFLSTFYSVATLLDKAVQFIWFVFDYSLIWLYLWHFSYLDYYFSGFPEILFALFVSRSLCIHNVLCTSVQRIFGRKHAAWPFNYISL